MKKVLKFIYKKINRYWKRFQLRGVYRELNPYLRDDLKPLFEGKRVAIVGPADSATMEKKGEYIDGFDLVIRLNKGYQLLQNEDIRHYVGSRTDVLFSRLDNRECLNPETFDDKLLESQKIQHLVGFWRTEPYGAYHRVLSFVREHSARFGSKIKLLTLETYTEILKSIGYSKPSVGYIALRTVLESDVKLLYVTGITFYLTGYQTGYRDDVTRESQIEKFKRRVDGHNPEKERIAFLKLYEKHKDRIELDSFLASHMELIQ